MPPSYWIDGLNDIERWSLDAAAAQEGAKIEEGARRDAERKARTRTANVHHRRF